MAIPENQLKTWARPGTVNGAKNTHAAIRKALALTPVDGTMFAALPVCGALSSEHYFDSARYCRLEFTVGDMRFSKSTI